MRVGLRFFYAIMISKTNEKRGKMSIFESAAALKGTMEMRGCNQAELARMLGVSGSYIANKLRLLSLEDTCRSMIEAAGLSERHARAVLRLKKEEQRLFALQRICEDGLNVAESEELIEYILSPNGKEQADRRERLSRVDSALDRIRALTSELSSIGVFANQRVLYREGKVWVTICIEEVKK